MISPTDLDLEMFFGKVAYLFNHKLADKVILRFCEPRFNQLAEVVKELSTNGYSDWLSQCSGRSPKIKTYLLLLEASVAVALPLVRTALHWVRYSRSFSGTPSMP